MSLFLTTLLGLQPSIADCIHLADFPLMGCIEDVMSLLKGGFCSYEFFPCLWSPVLREKSGVWIYF